MKSLKLLYKENGVASIEFSLTFIIFVFTILFIAETARLSYISAILDLAVSEAAKDAKNSDGNELGNSYQQYFSNRLIKQGGRIWSFIADPNAMRLNIFFANSPAEMIASGGSQGASLNKPLARYVLTYTYTPMFFFFPTSVTNLFFTREVIFVQEFERSQFMY